MATVWAVKAVSYLAALFRISTLHFPKNYLFFTIYLAIRLAEDSSMFMLYGSWQLYSFFWILYQCISSFFLVATILQAYSVVAAGIKGFERVKPWVLNISLGGAMLAAIVTLALEMNHREWMKALANTLIVCRFVDSTLVLFLLIVIVFLHIFQQKPAPNLANHLWILLLYCSTMAGWYSISLLKNGVDLRNLSTIAVIVCDVLICAWSYRIRPEGEVKYIPPIMPGELERLESERVAMLAGLSVLANGVKKSVRSPQK